MTQSYPSYNDIEPSWADVQIAATIDGGQLLEMIDIAAIKTGRKVEVGERRGASGGRRMARTTGSQTDEASMTLYRSGLRKFVKALAEKAPSRGNQKRISLVTFDITIQHTPPGETEIYTTVIRGCRYLGDSDDMKEGNEADKVEVTLDPMEIVQVLDDGTEISLL